MTDKINELLSEALTERDEIIGYECRDCGKQFTHGRDGRQHMFRQHDDPLGLRKLKE
jgi:hypothetical protein